MSTYFSFATPKDQIITYKHCGICIAQQAVDQLLLLNISNKDIKECLLFRVVAHSHSFLTDEIKSEEGSKI